MPYLPEAGAVVVEEVFFPAGGHTLHGELAYPEAGAPVGAAVIAGPHPLLGGNMHNNVVRGLGDGLARRGLLTLRFNYRGVGRSGGAPVNVARHLAQFWQTSHAPDEADLARDVEAAAAWLHATGSGLPRALIGYSFGCALLGHVRVESPGPLVLVGPTVGKHDYDAFLHRTDPILVIASDDDFASDSRQLDCWFDRLAAPKELIRRRLDNHFFRGHEDWLAETLWGFLEGCAFLPTSPV
jgi:alpha/beta superfamily hydrolase